MNNTITLIIGASSGIGRSLALALARERRRVGLIGLHGKRMDRVAEEVAMFGGEPFVAFSDVRDPASIRAALVEIEERGWAIDTVFVSAGICESVSVEHFHTGALRDMIEINTMGVAHWLEALQPVLKAQPGGGTVAVLSSLSADRSMPGGGAGYSASKAAVSQLLDGLRAPWAKQGIRLVTVAPGFVKTPLIAGTPRVPLAVEPEDAARLILDGVRSGRRIIRFPRLAALAMGVLRHLPTAVLDRLDRGEE